MTEPDFVEEWLRRYASAWEDADAGAAAGLFADEASYRSHIFRRAHEGRQGVRAYWEAATSTQSHVDVRWGRPLVDGERVAVEWWTVMVDAEEGEITLPGVLLLRFREDSCVELREYWHLTDGRREPYAGWGTVPAGDTEATRGRARQCAASYEGAWRAGDAEAAARLYSEEVESRTHPFREPARGRGDVLAYTQGAYASESDVEPRFGSPVAMDGGAAVEWWASYIEGGAPVTLAGCSLLSFEEGGLVTIAREYWHETSGRHLPPAGWGL